MQLHLFLLFFFSSPMSVHMYVISSFQLGVFKENKFCILHSVSIFVQIDFKEEIENLEYIHMRAYPFVSQIEHLPSIGI